MLAGRRGGKEYARAKKESSRCYVGEKGFIDLSKAEKIGKSSICNQHNSLCQSEGYSHEKGRAFSESVGEKRRAALGSVRHPRCMKSVGEFSLIAGFRGGGK